MDDLSRRRKRIARIEAQAQQPENVVFLVTAGKDETYHIVGAFSTYSLAQSFVDQWVSRAGRPASLQEMITIEPWNVDELTSPDVGAFWCRIAAGGTGDVRSGFGYEPTGDPDRPADTMNAVELDGQPMEFFGYGRTPEEARAAAVALRDQMTKGAGHA